MLKNAKRSSNWKYQGRVEERRSTAPILASTSFHLHADGPQATYAPEFDDEPVAVEEPASAPAHEPATPAGRADAQQWPSHFATGAQSVQAFQANPRLFVPPIGIPAAKGARAGVPGAGAVAGVAGHLRPNVSANAPVYTFGQHPGRRTLPAPGMTATAPAAGRARPSGMARVGGGAAAGARSQAKISAPKARPVSREGGDSGPRVYTYGTCQSCQDD